MKSYLRVVLVFSLCPFFGCDGNVSMAPPGSATSKTEELGQINKGEVRTQAWEVVTTTPATFIKHGVELKGYFDSEKAPVSLSGPELFSQSVGTESIPNQDPIAYLNWYRITKGEPESHGELTLKDVIVGEASYTVKVGSPAYLLSPSQRLMDGPPDAISEGLNYFKVYEIQDGPQLDKSIDLLETLGGDRRERRVTTAAFVCLPAEEWHHEQFFGIETPNSCLVVYALEPEKLGGTATSMDQFGIHELQLESSDWLCVTAAIVD